ncbi:hypothetical protein D3C76_767460 [compost metagenome]
MRSLAVIIILIALSGCVSSEWFPKGYSHELAYKCQINPYDPDCLQPPPVFKSS